MAYKLLLPIDNAPELAAALGRLMAHWADLESWLIHLLQVLLNVDNMKARFIYQEFNSTRGKITLIRRINHFFTLDETLKSEIDKLLGNINTLNETRNKFVHARWIGDVPQHIMRLETSLPGYKQSKKPMKKITPQDVQKVVEEIAELSQSLQNLIFPLLGVPLE